MFTNAKNQTVELFDNPYRLMRVEGLGETESSVQTQRAPYQDGVIYLDSVLNDKSIEIELKITGEHQQDLNAKRRSLASVFNPKLGVGKLRYISDDDIKEIDVVADAVPFFPDGQRNRKPTFQRSLVYLRALNPYWRDPQEVSRALRAYEGKFTFPFTFPVQFGVEGDVTTLQNDGDTSTPVIISIQGPIRRPMIENRTTGKHITINTTLTPEEVLYIDTSKQHKRVEIYRGNQVIRAMGYLDHNSDFWELEVGKNEIRYRADEGLAEAIAAISWHNQYVGI